jgi:hypothetical protein
MSDDAEPPATALRALNCLEQGAVCRHQAVSADLQTRDYYLRLARQWEDLADQLLDRCRRERMPNRDN